MEEKDGQISRAGMAISSVQAKWFKNDLLMKGVFCDIKDRLIASCLADE